MDRCAWCVQVVATSIPDLVIIAARYVSLAHIWAARNWTKLGAQTESKGQLRSQMYASQFLLVGFLGRKFKVQGSS